MTFQATRGINQEGRIISYRTTAMSLLCAWFYFFLHEREGEVCTCMCSDMNILHMCRGQRRRLGTLLFHSLPYSLETGSLNQTAARLADNRSQRSSHSTGLQSGIWLPLAFYMHAGVHWITCSFASEERSSGRLSCWEQPDMCSILLDVPMGYKQLNWIDHLPFLCPQSQVLVWPDDQFYENMPEEGVGVCSLEGLRFLPFVEKEAQQEHFSMCKSHSLIYEIIFLYEKGSGPS